MERNYWSKERIVELVEKYHITKRSQLLKFKKDGLCGVSAYSAANKLGILDELFGKTNKPKICLPASYWTDERIRKFVNDNNITTRTQLSEFNKDGISGSGAYEVAKKLGILDELFGKRVIWTEDKIRKLVEENNITSRKQLETFRKNGIKGTGAGAYDAAKRLGILDELFGKLEIIHYTKEMVQECALQCKTRSEFAVRFRKASDAARRHGWYEEVTKHMPIWDHKDIHKRIKYVVYAYEELSTHSVYVGLTNDCNRRDCEHHAGKNNDKLYEFCILNKVEIPPMKILKDKITATQASELEKKYWYQYKNDGWNMINTESCLGNLGGRPDNVWTEEKVRQCILEHPEIKTRVLLQNAFNGAYNYALKNKLLDELFGPNERKPYTREDIYKFMSEHPEIKNREDLRNAKPGMFKAAWRFKMLDELFGLATVREHSEEELREYLKLHPEIKRRTDLIKNNPQMHHVAVKLGLLQELFGDRENKWFTKEDIRAFVKEHPEIKTRKLLDDAWRGMCDAARRFGILDELFGKRQREKYSKEEVIEYMKAHPEIKRRKDLNIKNSRIYYAALKFNMLDDLFGDKWSSMYDENTIRQIINDNPEIKSRTQLHKFNSSIYHHAKELGILDELFPKK